MRHLAKAGSSLARIVRTKPHIRLVAAHGPSEAPIVIPRTQVRQRGCQAFRTGLSQTLPRERLPRNIARIDSAHFINGNHQLETPSARRTWIRPGIEMVETAPNSIGHGGTTRLGVVKIDATVRRCVATILLTGTTS